MKTLKKLSIPSALGQRITLFYARRTTNGVERVRLTMFIMGMILATIAVFIHLLGGYGLSDLRMHAFSYTYLLLVIVCCLLYFTDKWSLIRTFSVYGIGAQLIQSARIVMQATWYPSGASEAMLGNLIISYTLLLFVTFAFIHITPSIITALFVGSALWACELCHGGDTLPDALCRIFIFMEVFICILAYIVHRSVYAIQKESTGRQMVIDELRKTLGLGVQELAVFQRLYRSKSTHDKAVKYFFDNIDSEAEARIVKAVKQHEVEKSLRLRPLAERFPMLTPTEVEVSRLVMEGLTLKEIATQLNKSESNIGSVRVNIRKKLGIAAGQDLKEYLMA